MVHVYMYVLCAWQEIPVQRPEEEDIECPSLSFISPRQGRSLSLELTGLLATQGLLSFCLPQQCWDSQCFPTCCVLGI